MRTKTSIKDRPQQREDILTKGADNKTKQGTQPPVSIKGKDDSRRSTSARSDQWKYRENERVAWQLHDLVIDNLLDVKEVKISASIFWKTKIVKRSAQSESESTEEAEVKVDNVCDWMITQKGSKHTWQARSTRFRPARVTFSLGAKRRQ